MQNLDLAAASVLGTGASLVQVKKLREGKPSLAVECSIKVGEKDEFDTKSHVREGTYSVIAMLPLPSLISDWSPRACYWPCFPRHVSSRHFENEDRLLGLRV